MPVLRFRFLGTVFVRFFHPISVANIEEQIVTRDGGGKQVGQNADRIVFSEREIAQQHQAAAE